MAKAGRPKGTTGTKYTMSPAAHAQRMDASPMVRDQMFKEIIQRQEGMTPELQKQLEARKLQIWKQFNTPALMLIDEYARFKTLVEMKQLQSKDPTNKEIRECLRLLLDISKEVNRLSTVSADKKFEAMTKSFSRSDEIVVDVEVEE